MIEQEASVVGLSGDDARGAIQRQTACGGCAAKTGCGTSVVASLFPQRQQTLRLPNTQQARVGDRILVGLPETALQRASLLLYGIPLVLLLCGAVLGQIWAGTEPMAILGGLSGVTLGLLLVRRLTRHARMASMQPVMLRRLPAETAVSVPLQSLHS
jgi:sigma-E factor negative regulatory protein RseC